MTSTTIYVYIIENEVYWSENGEFFNHETINPDNNPLFNIFQNKIRPNEYQHVEIYDENLNDLRKQLYLGNIKNVKVFPGIDLTTDPKRDMLSTLLFSALQFHYKYQNIPLTIPEDVMKKLAYIIEIRKHHTF